MNSANTDRGQNRKTGLGHHWHVNQHAVAALDAQALVNSGHALDFALQLGEGIDRFLIGLGRNENQRPVIRTFGRMAVNRVMAKIGLAADKPFGKRRTGIVAHLGKRLFPINQLSLLGPELVRLFDGILVKLFVSRHKNPFS